MISGIVDNFDGVRQLPPGVRGPPLGTRITYSSLASRATCRVRYATSSVIEAAYELDQDDFWRT